MKKGQTFGMDALLAVGIFIMVIVVFVGIVLFSGGGSKTEDLQGEGIIIQNVISNIENDIGFINGDSINVNELNELVNTYGSNLYRGIKSELAIEDEFIIYFKDDQGYFFDMLSLDQDNDLYCIGPSSVRIEVEDGSCVKCDGERDSC
ncbi:hypothetical protein ACFL1H_05000 [Nanoarchaeota archaeon]